MIDLFHTAMTIIGEFTLLALFTSWLLMLVGLGGLLVRQEREIAACRETLLRGRIALARAARP
jgi:hypothetical protein